MGIPKGTKLVMPDGPRYSFRRSKFRDFFGQLFVGVEQRYPVRMAETGRQRLDKPSRKYGYVISIRKEYTEEEGMFNWHVTLKEAHGDRTKR